MKKPATAYDLDAIRALALHKQALDAPLCPDATPSLDEIYSVIERIGCVQLDTLQMVRRSQYLALWSRVGNHDPAFLDRLAFGKRRLFEYWLHAACLIPYSEYRYRLPIMRLHREGIAGWRRTWIQQPDNRKLVESVVDHVRHNGPVRSADFERKEGRSGSWWQWKPSKIALEHLYNVGDLMIANRVNFQRVYDLKERVLPEDVDVSEPTIEEMRRRLLESSMRSLGVCQPTQLSDYTHMRRNDARPVIEQFLADGTLVPVKARLMDGKTSELVIHRDDARLLEKAADGDLAPRRTTFLSPFDSLFWAQERDMRFWGFRKVIECYTPEPKRIWGYFCLPILHKDRLVGRFDPKLERKNRLLRLKAIYLEPGVEPDEELVASGAEAMRDFMAFHDARELVIERSAPAEFGDKLLKAMPTSPPRNLQERSA
ncbi:MAG: winged helix DNA-binding domain-containing protein [Chloroflexi bacterium]|nr:winged helix DNA-binding domain-containing protein [Chloroflexota bacterium]